MTGSQRPRVLIADDEKHCRTLLRAILDSMKCEVVAEAKNGEEAVELYREHRPHLMLLDINMPVKTGDVVLQELMREFPDAFIIMLTSVADLESIERCLAHGAVNYILKDNPIDEIKLIIRDSWQLAVQQRAGESRRGDPARS